MGKTKETKKTINKGLAAFVIVGLSVIVSFFIISSPKNSQKEGVASSFLRSSNNPFLSFQSSNIKTQNPTITQKISPLKTDNLTEELASIITESIANSNPDGLKEGKKIIPPDPNLLEEKTLQFKEKAAKFLGEDVFTEKDIIITDDNSKEAQLAYLKKLDETTKKNFTGFDKSFAELFNSWLETGDPSDVKTYTKIAAAQIKDLLAIRVPSLWKPFHLQNLNLWQKKLAAYQALLETKEDPVKAMVAFKVLPQLLTETVLLQETLQKKFIELKS